TGNLPRCGCTRNCITRPDRNDEVRMTNDEGMTKSKGLEAGADDAFWDDGAGLVREEPETKRDYDLEERTARFGEAIIDFAKTIPQNPVTNRIIGQLVGAGTSVGANYDTRALGEFRQAEQGLPNSA